MLPHDRCDSVCDAIVIGFNMIQVSDTSRGSKLSTKHVTTLGFDAYTFYFVLLKYAKQIQDKCMVVNGRVNYTL